MYCPAQSNGYLKKALPTLEFSYSEVPDAAQFARQPLEEVDASSLENLPIGLDGATYPWVGLDGEGISGILTEQADGWYYKRNLSPINQIRENGNEYTVARLGSLEFVSATPAAGLTGGQAQFLDLAGDGQVDLVQMEGPVRGFYERTGDANWAPFQAFVSWPNLNARDPNLKFVDLTGDGHADILITGEDVFAWSPSLAEEGFGPAERTHLPLDEKKGPRLVFGDGTQSIYLADLSGDGLTDLVRICNGEVCYWPNLDNGRFGIKVTMDDAPWFDTPDQFDQRRVRLADTDGSGTIDIIYLGQRGAQIFFNQSGNRWSAAVPLPQFPPIDDVASEQALDLLGNGTATLVWSSTLPGDTRRPMRYIDLMGGQKPHLLIKSINNLGAETHIQYAPSTKFYLADKLAGKPWITKIPVPVHVVEREEREFRGFGMVKQWDTEEVAALTPSGAFPDTTNIDESSHVPPVLTETWFHTGAYLDGSRITRQFEHEYYREGDTSRGDSGLSDERLESLLLDDTVLPDTRLLGKGTRVPYALSGEEAREAGRSLKGSILRQEIYALDRRPDGSLSDQSDRPYSVSERNDTIELLQSQGVNKHAVFFSHAREQIDFHYERKLLPVKNGLVVDEATATADPSVRWFADPRMSHSRALEVDAFGNVLRALAIGYRRRDLPGGDAPEQQETHVMLMANRFANRSNEADWYRVGLPVDALTYEVVKPPEPTVADSRIIPFSFAEMAKLAADLFPIDGPEPETEALWDYKMTE